MFAGDLPNFDCSTRCPTDVDDMFAFWSAYEPWFKLRGYTLFRRGVDEGAWWPPDTPSAPAFLPYASVVHVEPSPRITLQPGTNFAYAQDLRNRNVVFRIVANGSDEMAVYNRLMEHRSDFETGSFPCVLPPVDIIKSPHDFAFVATPMWGSRIMVHRFETFRDLLHFMQCTFTGLAYLHDLRIAHRDVATQNIVINCYKPTASADEWAAHMAKHRSSGDSLYALFDYDLSMAFDIDCKLSEYRLPAEYALQVFSTLPPPDVDQGEPDYNPFAYDVACLANIVLSRYWTAIPSVPVLAPLLDKMTTHVIPERFTAAEALQFLNDISPTLTEEQLCTRLAEDRLNGTKFLETGPSWADLPPEFVCKWGHYRRPPLPWWTRLLRWICRSDLGLRTVHYVRCKLRI